MSEELQKQLALLLEKLLAGAEQMKDFAAEQLPPLVADIVRLGRVEHTVFVLVGMAMLVAAVWYRRTWVSLLEDDDNPIGFFLPLGLVGGGFVLLVLNVHECFMAWAAPRLYIIEWLTDKVHR